MDVVADNWIAFGHLENASTMNHIWILGCILGMVKQNLNEVFPMIW